MTTDLSFQHGGDHCGRGKRAALIADIRWAGIAALQHKGQSTRLHESGGAPNAACPRREAPGMPDSVFPRPTTTMPAAAADAWRTPRRCARARGAPHPDAPPRAGGARRRATSRSAPTRSSTGWPPAAPRPAPITIYRALDFLIDNGLVHRIESRNAFLACISDHGEDGCRTLFLICEHCGAVGEASSPAVAETCTRLRRAAGFTPKAPVIEITGVCAHCA